MRGLRLAADFIGSMLLSSLTIRRNCSLLYSLIRGNTGVLPQPLCWATTQRNALQATTVAASTRYSEPSSKQSRRRRVAITPAPRAPSPRARPRQPLAAAGNPPDARARGGGPPRAVASRPVLRAQKSQLALLGSAYPQSGLLRFCGKLLSHNTTHCVTFVSMAFQLLKTWFWHWGQWNEFEVIDPRDEEERRVMIADLRMVLKNGLKRRVPFAAERFRG